MTFDYGLPAELFTAKRKRAARSRVISRRFATAAEAIRFAVEDFPAIRALGAWMQVGNERFDGEDIHRLYESHNSRVMLADAYQAVQKCVIDTKLPRRSGLTFGFTRLNCRSIRQTQTGRLPISVNVVYCWETAMHLESGAKRKWLARAQNVADHRMLTSATSPATSVGACSQNRGWTAENADIDPATALFPYPTDNCKENLLPSFRIF